MWNVHLRVMELNFTSLKAEYLHKLLETLLHEKFIPFLPSICFTKIYQHELMDINFILLYLVAHIVDCWDTGQLTLLPLYLSAFW